MRWKRRRGRDRGQMVRLIFCLIISRELLNEPSLFDRFCDSCITNNVGLRITLRAPARKSVRKRVQRDYANLNSGRESDPHRWLRVIEQKTIKRDPFRRLNGEDVNLKWLEEDEAAMAEPIVIENPEGLGMEMPDSEFTVGDVTELVGASTPLEVIGMSPTPAMTVGISVSPILRCGLSVDIAWLDTRQMERIYQARSRRSRQDPECHFVGGDWHETRRKNQTTSARQRFGLG